MSRSDVLGNLRRNNQSIHLMDQNHMNSSTRQQLILFDEFLFPLWMIADRDVLCLMNLHAPYIGSNYGCFVDSLRTVLYHGEYAFR